MTAAEALAVAVLGAFALGALLCWMFVQTWLRPLWESNAWWRSAPASVRDRITAQRAAAEQAEADRAAGRALIAEGRAQAAGPDDVTAIMSGLPRIPAHDPPPPQVPADLAAGIVPITPTPQEENDDRNDAAV